MVIEEGVSLASITTLNVGGSAKIVALCESVEDVKAAIALARDRGLSWRVLGGGSNILASDAGYEGLIIHFASVRDESRIVFEDTDSENGTNKTSDVYAIANANVEWDFFVETCVQRGYWGIENLAGIPGTVGAAPIQNIGAYGMEIADSLAWVEVLDTKTMNIVRVDVSECEFGYRESVFKRERSLIILRVAFRLSKNGVARASYVDIAARVVEGAVVATPADVATLVRSIRAGKFPNLTECGTAGSFFKNPVISTEHYQILQKKYPEIPGYSAPAGIKVSLAWILDKVLSLKGFAEGHVRLFEKQPLVLVTEDGATATDVDTFARAIQEKVCSATQIEIEREVQSL